jgi:two-component system nitrogen regulation response regulator NtrX
MRRLLAQVERVAASESRVCILGETGTGKELIARTIHDKSPRHDGPYITLNCAAVPAELIESELFGHEKGSFTGAGSRHIGKFEQAHEGTLFLDEIGDMPLTMQAKLLRVLEQGEVERIGGDKPIKVNVRVIVATHRNLEEQVKQGAFRQDLFHRIFVFPISLPPLRERPEDIPALANHFAAQITRQNGWKPVTFAPEAIEALQRHTWPGNIRELRNVIERMVIMNPTVHRFERKHLPPLVYRDGKSRNLPEASTLHQARSAYERDYILRKLNENHGNVSRTAEVLGLERSHLYRKMKTLSISVKE